MLQRLANNVNPIHKTGKPMKPHALIAYSWLLIGVLLLAGTPAIAQTTGSNDGNLGQENITVVGTYRPLLADGNRMGITPTLPELTQDSLPVLSYQVPMTLPPVSWSAPAVRPVALGKPNLRPLPNLFAKFGFGSQFTPYAEAAYTSGRSERLNYGFRGLYTSSNGNRENQLYSQAGGSLFGKYFAGPVAIGLEGGVQSEAVYFYGYDAEDTSFTKDESRQRFLRTNVALDLTKGTANQLGLDYHVRGGLRTQANITKDRETNPFLEASFAYPLPERPDRISLETGWELLRWSGPDPRSRNVLRFRPKYHYEKREWGAHAGFGLAVDTGRFLFFPDLDFHAQLLKDQLVFFVGWNMRLQSNSHRSLVDDNPWLGDSIGFRNSRMEDRYFGFRGDIKKQFAYQVRLSQKLVDDMPLFVNDSMDMRRFDILYEDITLFAVTGEVSWQPDARYRFQTSATGRRFTETGDQPFAWHEPSFTWQLSGRYMPDEKWGIQADILGMSATQARAADGESVRLRGTADISLGATYAYNRYFTLWAQANNLAGIRHQRYMNYPSYGIRAMAGLQFSF